MSIEELAALSRHYGSDPEYVIAGGGNTSFKNESTLWVKGSGVFMGEIKPGDFVKMDRGKLADIWKKKYSQDAAEREASVLAAMLAARESGEENKRPSVETLLHDLLPFPWVVHLHPALVNGLACSAGGREAAVRLFGPVIWIDSENPGYVLSLKVKEALEHSEASVFSGGNFPPGSIIFLQNHGVFAAADSPDGIRALYGKIMDTIRAEAGEGPDFSDAVCEYASSASASKIFAMCAGREGEECHAVFARNRAIAGLVADRAAFFPVSSAFTPDHIVYAGSDPLFVEEPPPGKDMGEHIREAWKEHLAKFGRAPKIAALSKTGVFGIGVSQKAARLALELFTDTVKVAAYAKRFGGPRFMEADKIAFINNWEAERYRSQRSGS
ncbi:MAG: class II aldolase/adducin family protein [Treponema sp.]|jgi:rhamnose utilization protein RhaD (predicted bifunctional aldolase and dehydrogenase)|nr:class II aldolase/adducin family protein [Treponema sp.]